MHSSAIALVVSIALLVRCEACLGAYILAALGQKPTYTNTTTATSGLNTTASSIRSLDASTPMRSTVCYNGGGRCWDDVTYISPTIAPTGTGAAYATSCSNVISAYNSASNSWVNKHSFFTNYTNVLGGTSWNSVTYYANATTLCDGHARVNYSPAIATSSTVITSVGTAPSTSVGTASMGWIFPISTVSCSVDPSDCDGLWQAYSTASSKWTSGANGTRAVDAIFPTITPSPSQPACVNSSQSSSNEAFSKSFYGCGLCTIFGDEVELLYFPEATTASRDMCAITPTAKPTAYGSNDGIPYTGIDPSAVWNGTGTSLETAVVGKHTFVRDGQAYISIKKVYAKNRCSSQIGTTVTDAILALPSDRLLSLRYSQDHFQYFATTNKITGYPFNYADLNTPVPYSAWNGQARCEFPGAADYKCNVIYENQYNPQLAMPPGIRKLDPAWEGCQMWYGGLYDPPYALKPGTAVETPTVAFGPPPTTSTSAAEASSAAPTTATPTALADHTSERADSTQGQGNNGDSRQTQGAEETQAANTAGRNQDGQAAQTQNGQNTQASQNTQSASHNNDGGNSQGGSDGQNSQGGAQNTQGGQSQNEGQGNQGGQSQTTAQGGQSQNAGQDQHWNPTQAGAQNTQGGQNNQGANTANGAQNTQGSQAQNGSPGGNSQSSAKPQVYVFTAGTFTYTATKTAIETNTVYVCGTDTLSVGGPAATLPVNCVISAGSAGLVINTEAATITNRASAVTALPVNTKAVIVTVGTKVQTFSQDSSGVVKIGSTRLTPGGSAATLDDGSVVSADSEGVKVGSTIVKYSTVAPASAAAPDVLVFVVGTKTVTVSCPPGSTNQAIIGSITLTAGAAAQTLEDGSRVSLASGGNIVIDGTSAGAIATPASAVVFTVNGNAVTAYQASGVSSVVTIDGTVISRDGSAVTLSGGEVVSMGSSGLVVQQGSTTVPVSAFITTSDDDDSSSSSGAPGSRSGSRAASNSAAMSSTRSAQQNQGSQASATSSKSGAASTIKVSTTASLVTTVLLISPLLFAIYL
ncbi:unnamed protein product [Aureobasidium uvarum]|uniref:Uncharacterized protein n=1 Tax=Aureobasidium uvarum TaxID=2773716 RepID=A0A9N8PVU7_9PEZI|nr:unnamed protein product [Aureobasidium uvarum]